MVQNQFEHKTHGPSMVYYLYVLFYARILKCIVGTWQCISYRIDSDS